MTKQQKYDKAIAELFALGRFGIKLGLDTITAMLEGVGKPHLKLNCIHIAGTNGKGSVAQALAAILKAAGYKVGVYTSPHLIDINERFVIDGQPISDSDVLDAYEAIKNASKLDRQPTFFEYTTAMALYAFDKAEVDWAVMETGMGGRLDATNILKPKLSIITNISVEHEMYLGNTIAKIAYEKAGIIKKNTPIITGVRQKSAIKVVKEAAKKQNAPIFRFGQAFSTRRLKNGKFSYYGMDNTWKGLLFSLVGDHQAPNAALALAGCEVLISSGADINEQHVRKGLAKTSWPGRLEKVCDSPQIILDGAHNLAAMRVLSKYLSATYTGKKIIIITGFLDDKPYPKMLSMLENLADRILITRPKINRAVEPETLVDLLKQSSAKIYTFPEVANAVKHAVKTAAPSDVIVVAGSLYVVGEARQALLQMGLL